LWFLELNDNTRLVSNRFGIPEPEIRSNASRPAWALDLILMPLVGFTERGDRLGMGGGFYDRTFEFLHHAACHKPKLIGLAHECQRVATMPTASWEYSNGCHHHRWRPVSSSSPETSLIGT
jgi:5-formyltetrahydrofolate cyclo-ligase